MISLRLVIAAGLYGSAAHDQALNRGASPDATFAE